MDSSKIVTSPSKLLPSKSKGGADKSLMEASIRSDFDDIDGLRAKANFNWLDVTCIVVSIFSYLADLVTDGFMAATYFHKEHYWYFAFTVTFFIIPAFTMTGLSTKWYIKDQSGQQFPPVSRGRWAFRIFCLIFFLSPVARYYILKFSFNKLSLIQNIFKLIF